MPIALAVLRFVIAERRDAPHQQAFSIVEMQVWQSLVREQRWLQFAGNRFAPAARDATGLRPSGSG